MKTNKVRIMWTFEPSDQQMMVVEKAIATNGLGRYVVTYLGKDRKCPLPSDVVKICDKVIVFKCRTKHNAYVILDPREFFDTPQASEAVAA